MQLWLDPSIGTDEMPNDPSQIPFPREMSAIDLGPAVTDAIILVLPSVNLCGRPDCNIKRKHADVHVASICPSVCSACLHSHDHCTVNCAAHA